MSHKEPEIVIIGAGLSGLACAIELLKNGKKALILEKSDGPGGRVRTDKVEGFLFDRGFQVFLDSYPTASALFDLPQLDLKKIEPGAMVFTGGKLHRVMDVVRRPQHLLAGLMAPVGNIFDKVLVTHLRRHVIKSSVADIWAREEQTTTHYLRRFGFSERMLNGFFKSFYGGIFLERDLQTSSRMFEFTFKMFSEGFATLPANGIGELPKQLAERIPKEQIRYQCPVGRVVGNQVHLLSGEVITASAIVIATPHDAANALVPSLNLPEVSWRSVTTLYFSATQSPLSAPILALNGEGSGLVNNLIVLSDLCPNYAPQGQHLISVSLIGIHRGETLADEVKEELHAWFGEEVSSWRHLRTDAIRKALPEQRPESPQATAPKPPLYLCGDYLTSASIEGAIISGQEAAKKILAQ